MLDFTQRRCGVIHAGDRILSVNGFVCEEFTVDDVNQLLAEAYQNGQVGGWLLLTTGLLLKKLDAQGSVTG